MPRDVLLDLVALKPALSQDGRFRNNLDAPFVERKCRLKLTGDFFSEFFFLRMNSCQEIPGIYLLTYLHLLSQNNSCGEPCLSSFLQSPASISAALYSG